mgnify:CR=1 FL=1
MHTVTKASFRSSKPQNLYRGEARNFFKSQSPYEGELGIFPSPRGCIVDQSLTKEEGAGERREVYSQISNSSPGFEKMRYLKEI